MHLEAVAHSFIPCELHGYLMDVLSTNRDVPMLYLYNHNTLSTFELKRILLLSFSEK